MEARTAFEQASAHGPVIAIAMLLRRECDRALEAIRAAVGSAERDCAHDVPAQLLLASMSLFEHDAAGALYDHLLAVDTTHQTTALLGRADALRQLGRTSEAEQALDAAMRAAGVRSVGPARPAGR